MTAQIFLSEIQANPLSLTRSQKGSRLGLWFTTTRFRIPPDCCVVVCNNPVIMYSCNVFHLMAKNDDQDNYKQRERWPKQLCRPGLLCFDTLIIFHKDGHQVPVFYSKQQEADISCCSWSQILIGLISDFSFRMHSD